MSETAGDDIEARAATSAPHAGGSRPDWSRPDWSRPDWAAATEDRVLRAAIQLAAERPWNKALVLRAAELSGLGRADADLLLPNGSRDLVALLSRRHDAQCLERLGGTDASSLKVRERIRVAVAARIESAMADEAATRRASLFLARPDAAKLALTLAWESADRLWRWAGDTSTDENHYTKRAILAGVLVSTLGVRLSLGNERADQHLANRIDNVMAFERWKAGLPRPSDMLSSAASLLGRLRYGSRALGSSPAPLSEEEASAG